MNLIHFSRGAGRRATRFSMAVLAAGLVACGGGGGDDGPSGGPTVSTTSVASASIRFGRALILSVSGNGVDTGIALASSICTGSTRLDTAPYVSSATTAFYQCTLSGVGAGDVRVTRASDGATLATQTVTVAVPQVTITLGGISGTFVVTLAPDKAPITVANFLSYVNAGFYDGTVIHRVVPGFVVQGGGYVAPLTAAPGTLRPTHAPIVLESNTGLSNVTWSIAMARTASPNSATSQFFINLADNSATLDASPVNGPGYAVFGTVSGGTSAITAIVTAPCTAIPFFLPSGECTPNPNVSIVTATQTQ